MSLKVLLANAPNPTANGNASNYACYPHIGVVQLATAVRDTYGGQVELRVVDGGISNTAQVQQAVRDFAPDVVGISALTPTYGEALKIAATAKQAGAQVVLGDDHAGFFPELILDNRPEIDYIVANDVGETPFVELIGTLIQGCPVTGVSSLVHRRDGVAVRNPAPQYALTDRNTIPDLGFIRDELDIYAENYREQFGHLHSHKVIPITVNNARGCENGYKRCTYCSIADLRVNTGDPRGFWKAIDVYNREFGINLFFEVYDSFTASPRYVDALIDATPPHLRRRIDNGELEVMVYARALGLTKRNNVDKCRRLGVTRVNIGLDAADPEMLEAQRKNKTTDATNLEAIRMLNKAGISVHASYIAGAPGERARTLDRTIDGIRQMLGEVELSSVEFSRFIPLPNSPAWDLLVDYERPNFFKDSADIDAYLSGLDITITPERRAELYDRFGEEDLLDIEELAAAWAENFTHITEEYALRRIADVDELVTAHNVRTGNNVG
ncbi:B12-binding domain-containing radical SAM protein [Streptomyces sp. Je 1-79]|uniref:B12-binding domain-containing radical SAM protein n=1 Tax=Streptomyces sp. Je 1-79 TaxID=2943847 RepID=UPI0021A4A3DD|nr:radical SAM protein [Streptomyces sp. Je 1-79]MCT4356508.1 B12-binding domain-containing radical SAM protein [Streptomyces sp. Je 1-79]